METNVQMEIVKSDPNAIELIELGGLMTSESVSEQDFLNYFKRFEILVSNITKAYGLDNLEYLAKIEGEKITKARIGYKDRCGDICHLNCDNSVNRDNCNFFQRVLVFAGSTTCITNSGQLAFNTCVQDIVCGIC